MKSRYHEAAEAEVTEAVDYYDAKAPGLGDRFLVRIRGLEAQNARVGDQAALQDS